MTNTDTVLCRTTLSILFSTDLINTQVDLLSAALPLLKTSAFITFGPVYVSSTLSIYIYYSYGSEGIAGITHCRPAVTEGVLLLWFQTLL